MPFLEAGGEGTGRQGLRQTEAEVGVEDTLEWHPHSTEWIHSHLLKDLRELTE